MSSADRPPLQQLLGKAVKAPNYIHTSDGGAVLALALHCLFVQAGFTNGHAQGPVYPPQKDWNRSPDAWAFQYRRNGYANTFSLTCGLKQSTGQAYVHVTEDNGGDNVSFMGLLLHKYIPDTATLRQDNWQGVVANEEVLTNYFDNYIMQPVLTKAVPSSDDEPADSTNRRRQLSAAGVAVAFAALLVIRAKAK